jgi:3-hydroxybutyrate dehydrogenase
MKARKWGRIINIASAHGLVASEQKVAYVSAKHGLVASAGTPHWQFFPCNRIGVPFG